MRRHQHNSPQSLFHGNELMRLLTMVGMLGVLLLVIARSSDPNTWSWLAGEAESSQPSAMPVSDNDRETPQKSDEMIFGTDLDPEESDAIKEEFQAVSDGTESILPEEMSAYNRLLRWVEKQTLSEMRGRAKKDAVFTQFHQTPDEFRGQLFELELNVRRILKYSHDGVMLYEIWGWTPESRSWPYECVVIDLPKGMPIGPEVHEKATFVGYFFKMQGYLEAGAKPRDNLLKAPLLVGRLIWRPTDTSKTQPTDWSWGIYLLAAFVVFLIIRWGLFFHGRSRRGSIQSPLPIKPDGKMVDQWLSEAESNGPGEEEKSNGDS